MSRIAWSPAAIRMSYISVEYHSSTQSGDVAKLTPQYPQCLELVFVWQLKAIEKGWRIEMRVC
jgi:hypothetical protein